ncbi:hypothetical protein, partial [Mycolicibacterium sp. CBMA 295]|uniref:hypothetical protein n=3 Tax=Mycolicibacterium TaxID=1866885 RepID=UPI001EE49306
HVLSTPPAFVLSQNQTLQTKTSHPKTGRIQSEKSDHKQKTPTNWHQKNKQPHPKREKEHGQKQQTKTTKHTIEFSNNTPEFAAQKPRG